MKTTKRTRHDATELYRLSSVNGSLDEGRARHVLQRVVQLQPRGCLALLTEFQRLVKLEHAQHAARVESATPLPPEAATKVRARLAQAYGPGVNPSFVHNPALIGGIRITVGSDVFDGSVRGRLAALQRSF